MKGILAIAVLAFSGAAYAAPITIDFDDLVPGSGDPYPELFPTGVQFSTQGFTFNTCCGASPYTNSDGIVEIEPGNNVLRTTSVPVPPTGEYFGADIYMWRSDNQAFAFYGADIFSPLSDVTGFYATTSAGDIISDGAAPPLLAGSYTEVALGELDWLSITSLSFYCDVPDSGGFGCSYDLDNVVVGAAVPIPAAAWLFLSALGLLGVRRRLGAQ